MIQDINFLFQLVCGIIVGKEVIETTEAGKKFLNFASKTKLMLLSGKINFLVDILVVLFLFFLFEIPFPVLIGFFFVWLNIPIFLQQYQQGIPTWKILTLKGIIWIALGLVVWHKRDLTMPYPYSLALILTNDTTYIFWYGLIGLVFVGILCDYIVLKFSINMHKFINSNKVFAFAMIMFFFVCPIIEYSKWNTFQDIAKSMEAKKNSFLKRLPSLSPSINQEKETKIKEKTIQDFGR